MDLFEVATDKKINQYDYFYISGVQNISGYLLGGKVYSKEYDDDDGNII